MLHHAFRWLVMLGVTGILASAELPAVLGVWENPQDPGDMYAFEADRAILLVGGELGFSYARYAANGAVRLGWLGEERLHVEVKGDTLAVRHADGASITYRKAVALPPAMQVQPMAMAKGEALTPVRRIALDYQTTLHQQGRADPRAAQVESVDADDLAWVKAIIAELGWPDVVRCGRETTSTVIAIIQRSDDLPLMTGALPFIEADLKNGGDPQWFALLYDRVQLLTGRKQRYGTQVSTAEDGTPTVFPLENRGKVEEWRKAIGLFPFSEYMEWFGSAPVYMDDLPLAP